MITVDYVDLGRRPPSTGIAVTHQGSVAYVEVITADNFQLLRAEKDYQCVYSQQLSNGRFTYTIPTDDHWYVVAVGDGTLEVDVFLGAQLPGTPLWPVAGKAHEFTLPSDPSPRHLPMPAPVNPPGEQPRQRWTLADIQRMNDQAVVERASRVGAAKKELDAAQQNFGKVRANNPDKYHLGSRIPQKYTPSVVVEAQKRLDNARTEYGDAVSNLVEVPDYSDGNSNMLSISYHDGGVYVADPTRQYTYIYSGGELVHSAYWDPGQTTVDTEFEGLIYTALGGISSGALRGIKALVTTWGARRATSAAEEGVQVVDELATAAQEQAAQSQQRLALGAATPTSSGVTSAATRIGEEVKAIPNGGPSQTETLAQKLTALRLGQTEAAEATNIASKTAFGETAGIASLPDGSKLVLPIYLEQGIAMQVFPNGSVSVFRGDLYSLLRYLGK